ncbi:SPT3 Dosage dependent suppressor of Ty-induced promoter mutations-like protein [Coemansia aciculifera]|uniref:SPT3 Dosage dependent suppressor of Ty-induced promoter mutations-like protein n=1 Tax=Coemansia aciculifera TaxID=417176 RepID=A0A9W8IG77_9FUNG|nr:SPT3 Dosage dependent suppressor of Ty-induced promoter mutations-like protein [Coemansia aciculifera]KAJ2872282.1 SPT3 Dosage dependent suppressor of Ty-induced promoter mutations-like protein [Coemansia aciculifera]
MASSANSGGATNNINDYLRVSSAGESGSTGHGGYQAPGHLLPPDLSAFLMTANAATRSTPGSPATFNGGLGFHSVRTSPALVPSMPQSPAGGNGILHNGSFTNLAALGGTHPMFSGLDSTIHSAVQSATASPIVGAFNRRGLQNSMANLSMAQLPPTAMGYMDVSGMFGSPTIPFSNSGAMAPVPSISVSNPGNQAGAHAHHAGDSFRAPAAPMQQEMMLPAVTAEFLQHVEQTRARGLKIELEGIPQENAKSRVETQIKITLRLNTEDTGERATCWTHLALPELLVSREKFRHQMQKRTAGYPGDTGKMPLSPEHVVHLEAGIFCSSDPTRKVETCLGCIRREYKRSLRRKDAASLRSGAPSTCTTPAQSRPGSPIFGDSPLSGGQRLTGSMEADWDEQRIALEKQRIVIFNCSDILDFSKGEVVLPTRVTCYCRHHNEKEGFCICLTLRDAQGNVLATHISPPIMITDDHKSTKFKTDRKSTRSKPEYDRQGDGSAVYANHALAGLASPLGNHPSHLHLVDGSLAGFKGGRQAMSARNSPTLKPYAHHAILDTYSQFASLAGTPSLGNTPLGSPILSAAAAAAAAAQMSGFDSPFHLPQAASSLSATGSSSAGYSSTQAPQSSSSIYGNLSSTSSNHSAVAAAAAAAIAASGYSSHHQHNGGHYSVPNSATGSGPLLSGSLSASSLQLTPAYAAGLAAASSENLLFGNTSGFAQPANAASQQQQQQQQPIGGTVQVSQLYPVQGPVAGGISVLIVGRGFHPNIAVYFGGVQAGRVQVLSPNNITCVLPPTKTAGHAVLRIRDLFTMAFYDGSGEGQAPVVFNYVEDTDHTMIELSLYVIGLRPPQQQAENPALSGMGSPQMSPVMGDSLLGGSPQRKSSPSSAAASAKMLQDPVVFNTLRQLRAANDGRNLVEIEAGLVSLFGMLLGKNMLDVARLSMRHEATGRTLLHFAALLGMLNLMSYLATNGVSLDEVDHNGMTAMHFASMYGRVDIVEMLLGAGAMHGVRSALGSTPAELARILGHTQIQMVIEERDGYMNFIRDDPSAVAAFSAAQEGTDMFSQPMFSAAAAAQPPHQYQP